MPWPIRLMLMGLGVCLIALISQTAHCAPIDAQVAEVSAKVDAIQGTVGRVLDALKVQTADIKRFWQKEPIFRDDLMAALELAREEREKAQAELSAEYSELRARVISLEESRAWGTGFLVLFFGVLGWVSRSRVPIIKVREPKNA